MLRLFRRTVSAEPPRILLRIDGEPHAIAVRRLASARRFTLRVRSAQRDIVLSMPARASLASARAFAQAHAGWIAVRLARLAQDIAFLPGESVPLRGVLHRIEHREGVRGTVSIEPGVLAVRGRPEHLPRRLADWLKRQALTDLQEAVSRHAAAAGARATSVSVKDTSSRWGSCSAAGALSFSWRLILAPPFVLDYLAAHEVAHLKEMNHSARFWRLCAKLCPRTAEAKAWLKAHGADLHRYGRVPRKASAA